MTTQQYQNMVDEIKANIGADEEPSVIEEVADHGADAGWGGFTYTRECVEFYDRHKDAIWEMLREDADSFGYSNPMEMVATFNRSDMLDDEDSFKNLLAWYALETVCQRLVDEGEHLEEDEEEEDEDEQACVVIVFTNLSGQEWRKVAYGDTHIEAMNDALKQQRDQHGADVRIKDWDPA